MIHLLRTDNVPNQVTIISYTVLLFTSRLLYLAFLELQLSPIVLDNPSGCHMWDVPASNITVHYVRVSTYFKTIIGRTDPNIREFNRLLDICCNTATFLRGRHVCQDGDSSPLSTDFQPSALG